MSRATNVLRAVLVLAVCTGAVGVCLHEGALDLAARRASAKTPAFSGAGASTTANFRVRSTYRLRWEVTQAPGGASFTVDINDPEGRILTTPVATQGVGHGVVGFPQDCSYANLHTEAGSDVKWHLEVIAPK